jgi:hypothetical protein
MSPLKKEKTIEEGDKEVDSKERVSKRYSIELVLSELSFSNMNLYSKNE